MKKLTILVIAILLASCDKYVEKASKTNSVVGVQVIPESSLNNNLLRPLDGKRNIQNSLDIIAYPWSSDWGALYIKLGLNDNSGIATDQQKVAGYKIVNAKTIRDVFYSLPMDNEWKWLTQSQIVEFCLSNREFIRNSKNDILFFVKMNENKAIYERKLSEEVIAIVIKSTLPQKPRFLLGELWHLSSLIGVTVIVPQKEVKVAF